MRSKPKKLGLVIDSAWLLGNKPLQVVVWAVLALAISSCSSTSAPREVEARARYAVDTAHQTRERSSGFEVPPALRPHEVFSQYSLPNSPHRLIGNVLNDGLFDHVLVQVNVNELYAGSATMLTKRVHEAGALSILNSITDSRAFGDAAKNAGVGIVMAPVRGVQSLAGAVADPEQTWNTVSGAPAGAGRLLRSAYSTVHRGVSRGGRAVGIGSNGENGSAEDREREGIDYDRVLETVTDFTMSHFGFNLNSRVRQWQQRLAIDPFTDITAIHLEIQRIAQIESSVNVGSMFLPGIGGLAFVSQANTVLRHAERLSLYRDPRDLVKSQLDFLRSAGVADELIATLLTHPFFTPTLRAIMFDQIKQLSIPAGTNALLQEVADLRSQEDILALVQSLELLLTHNRRRLDGVRLAATGPVLVARISRAETALIVAGDRMFWNRPVNARARNTLKQARAMGSQEIVLMHTGTVSDRARTELRELGFARVTAFDSPRVPFWS